jgi:hypothetical protein
MIAYTEVTTQQYLDNNKTRTYERTGDAKDKVEFDAACVRFQYLKGDFKSLHRMKYGLYIEGIESVIKSDPRSFFGFANMK